MQVGLILIFSMRIKLLIKNRKTCECISMTKHNLTVS